MAEVEVKLEFNSRFKKTPLYTKEGRTFFGVWDEPTIKLDGDEKIQEVDSTTSLDILAYEEYGDRALWWAIARANKMKNPEEELVPGMDIIIPKPENVRTALLEQRSAPSDS